MNRKIIYIGKNSPNDKNIYNEEKFYSWNTSRCSP